MNEKPILFSGAMVRAILEGRKTQTRRIIKPQFSVFHGIYSDASISTNKIFEKGDGRIHCPYGQVGDRLWVKETFVVTGYEVTQRGLAVVNGYYCAGIDKFDVVLAPDESKKFAKWRKKTGAKPSIYMFRSLSRLTLETVGVRVERLREIRVDDAMAEGVRTEIVSPFEANPNPMFDPVAAYRDLWESINGAGSWAKNPYVWALTFKRIG